MRDKWKLRSPPNHVTYVTGQLQKNPLLQDFDIVVVVLHRGSFEWMERQKNASATTVPVGRFRGHSSNYRNQDANVKNVQKMPVNGGVWVNELMEEDGKELNSRCSLTDLISESSRMPRRVIQGEEWRDLWETRSTNPKWTQAKYPRAKRFCGSWKDCGLGGS
jgi:hypothetical protein